MTVTDLARCDYCMTDQPASGLYQPLGGILRCKDGAGCAHRQQYAGTNTLPDFARPGETALGTPTPPAATCAVCGAPASAAALYERVPSSSQWFCRDRPACDLRTATDMTPVREDFTDWVITSAEMRHTVAAGGVAVPESRPAPDPADVAAQAWSDTMGRRAVTPQGGDLASQMGLRQ